MLPRRRDIIMIILYKSRVYSKQRWSVLGAQLPMSTPTIPYKVEQSQMLCVFKSSTLGWQLFKAISSTLVVIALYTGHCVRRFYPTPKNL